MTILQILQLNNCNFDNLRMSLILLLLLYYVLLYIIYGTAVINATDDVVEDEGKTASSTCTEKIFHEVCFIHSKPWND